MKIIFVLVFTTILWHTGVSQTGGPPDKYPETVIIKVFESYLNNDLHKNESKMIIVDADGHTVVKPLQPAYTFKKDNNEEEDNNIKKLQTELQTWQNKGFQVKSMSSALVIDVAITIIILQKN